nr:M4 family metallopeptidase [Clostridium rhizosphaerae]
MSFHENKGLNIFISGKISDKVNVNNNDIVNYLEENKELFGLTNTTENFKISKIEKDELGYTKVKINQLIKGDQVKGKELVVHVDKDGIISNITGNIENKIKDTKVLGNTRITEKEAVKLAEKELKFKELRTAPKVEKQVIIKDDTAYEVYNVNIQYNEPEIGNWNIYIEANSGQIIDKEDNIRYDGTATGSGVAVDGTTKPLNLYLSSGTYQMKDTTKPMSGQINTYTAGNKQVEPGTLVTNSSSTFNTTALKASVSAHYYAGVVYDFYKSLFNRNSIDNNGMSIISTTHYGSAYNNAFWDGTQMVYGDGDGSQFTYLSGDLDVVAHELTHGVTSYTANLNYSNQSGALNESMSDVLGVLVNTYDKYNVKGGGTWTFNSSDWVVGDAVYTPSTPGDALRSLANPSLYSQPDNMSKYVNTTSDNGGVHTNSGIPNKAAFLVAQSIGSEKTARIYYRALTNYMTANTDFLGARNAVAQAAADLYGASGTEVSAVSNAFNTVGVVSVSDSYEPNNTLSQAYAITSGTTYSSYISSSSDIDYYKLSTSTGRKITISLSTLPKDYDLYLYNSSGNLLASSENGSTTSESISFIANYTGAYYILVGGYNGAYSTTTKYSLKATY